MLQGTTCPPRNNRNNIKTAAVHGYVSGVACPLFLTTISNLSNSFSALSDSVSSDDSPNTSTEQEKKGKQKGHQLKNVQEATDIICGSESHLEQSIPSSEIFPDLFQVLRKDRNRNGGGVFIAVKNA